MNQLVHYRRLIASCFMFLQFPSILQLYIIYIIMVHMKDLNIVKTLDFENFWAWPTVYIHHKCRCMLVVSSCTVHWWCPYFIYWRSKWFSKSVKYGPTTIYHMQLEISCSIFQICSKFDGVKIKSESTTMLEAGGEGINRKCWSNGYTTLLSKLNVIFF